MKRTVAVNENQASSPSERTATVSRAHKQGWSVSQRFFETKAKRMLADYYARHEFLRPLNNPADDNRHAPHALVLVNAGTTSADVCGVCLADVAERWRSPFHIRWQTPGAMLTGIIQDFISKHPDCHTAAELSLLPGVVNWETESVVGDEPVHYLQSIQRYYTYTFLSAHRINLQEGRTYFFFPSEIGIQRSLATRPSKNKNLFLTPSKFGTIEGDSGYTIKEMLANGNVNIYAATVDDENLARRLIEEFGKLCDRLKYSIIDASGQPKKNSAKNGPSCVVAPDVEFTSHVSGHKGTLRLRIINSLHEAQHGLDAIPKSGG